MLAESVGGSHDTSILLGDNTLAFIFLGCPGAETMTYIKEWKSFKIYGNIDQTRWTVS